MDSFLVSKSQLVTSKAKAISQSQDDSPWDSPTSTPTMIPPKVATFGSGLDGLPGKLRVVKCSGVAPVWKWFRKLVVPFKKPDVKFKSKERNVDSCTHWSHVCLACLRKHKNVSEDSFILSLKNICNASNASKRLKVCHRDEPDVMDAVLEKKEEEGSKKRKASEVEVESEAG